MNKSKIMLLSLFIVLILAMSAVSAADESDNITLTQSPDDSVSLEMDSWGGRFSMLMM